MSNFNATGSIGERIGVGASFSRVYSPNYKPKIKVTTRIVEKQTGNLTGTSVWVGIGSLDLTAGEVVVGVYAFGKAGTQQNNSALWYPINWRWNSYPDNFQIHWYRAANDGSYPGSCTITIAKFEIDSDTSVNQPPVVSVRGTLSERGTRVYSAQNKPTLTVSSRCFAGSTVSLSGTGRWATLSLTKSMLAEGEAITDVYALGHSSGQYANNALWYLGAWQWSSEGNLQIYMQRGSADHNDIVKAMVTIVKLTVS